VRVCACACVCVCICGANCVIIYSLFHVIFDFDERGVIFVLCVSMFLCVCVCVCLCVGGGECVE